MAISSITLSELIYGAEKSMKIEKKDEVIGENDIYIAGHATSQGLILVTNNMREFKRVQKLVLENWVI